MDGWNLLQFKTKIGKKARQKCMVPRVVPKTPKYPLYLKMIAEKSMPRVKPTNAKMSSIPILQYLLGGENTWSPKYSLTWWFCSLWWWCQTCRHTYLQVSQLTSHSMSIDHIYYCNQLIKSSTNQEDTVWAKDTEDSCHNEVFSFPVEEVDVEKEVETC